MRSPAVHLRRYGMPFMAAVTACGADHNQAHLPATAAHADVTCGRCWRTHLFSAVDAKARNQPLALEARR